MKHILTTILMPTDCHASFRLMCRWTFFSVFLEKKHTHTIECFVQNAIARTSHIVHRLIKLGRFAEWKIIIINRSRPFISMLHTPYSFFFRFKWNLHLKLCGSERSENEKATFHQNKKTHKMNVEQTGTRMRRGNISIENVFFFLLSFLYFAFCSIDRIEMRLTVFIFPFLVIVLQMLENIWESGDAERKKTIFHCAIAVRESKPLFSHSCYSYLLFVSIQYAFFSLLIAYSFRQLGESYIEIYVCSVFKDVGFSYIFF